jgi:hypothetical protein
VSLALRIFTLALLLGWQAAASGMSRRTERNPWK